jgi:hypothetical protein
VCGFVVTLSGCGNIFGLEKNGKKRGVVRRGCWLLLRTTEAYAEGVRSNVCATGSCPHVSPSMKVGSR